MNPVSRSLQIHEPQQTCYRVSNQVVTEQSQLTHVSPSCDSVMGSSRFRRAIMILAHAHQSFQFVPGHAFAYE